MEFKGLFMQGTTCGDNDKKRCSPFEAEVKFLHNIVLKTQEEPH